MLTHGRDGIGSGRLHGLLSVISVFGKTVDHNGLRGFLLSLLPTHRDELRVRIHKQQQFYLFKLSIMRCLPLQPFLRLLPLRHLRSAVVVVLLSRWTDVFGPVIGRITLRGGKGNAHDAWKPRQMQTTHRETTRNHLPHRTVDMHITNTLCLKYIHTQMIIFLELHAMKCFIPFTALQLTQF